MGCCSVTLAVLINDNFKDYIDEKEMNYENNFSKTGIMMSSVIEKCVQSGLQKTFEFLNSVFNG